MKKILLFCLYIVFCSQLSKSQSVIYVSVHGNDHNAGTLVKPLLSLNKAIGMATANPKKTIIFLRQGTYYNKETIKITSLKAPLTISAFKGESVNLSAGRKLNLQFEPYRNGILKAEIPIGISFERLYIDNKLQVLARYPNFDSTKRVFNGTASDAIAPSRVKTWKNPMGGYIHALHNGEWGGFHYRITGVNADGTLQTEGGWQNNRPAPMHNQFRFVENIFEELDTVGEWYLDSKSSTLYFYAPKNFNQKTALIEVSNLKNTIEVRGTSAKPIKNIEIKNITFLHNESSFWQTKEPLLRSDWTIYRGGAVVFEGTENCKITNCTFTGIGGNAIMVSNFNKLDTISNNHIHHIGANAISFVGSAKAVRSPSFRYEEFIPYVKLDKTPGPLSNDYPQQCVVDNNLLHNLGQIEKQATGVLIEISSEIKVSHNSIYNTPRAGLNISDGCFGGNVLEFNDVFNTVLETGDHGSFNSWGRDRYWLPNRNSMDSLVASHPELILLDAQKTTVIRNNRLRCDHGWDLDLDDGSSNYHIYNNLCLNGGLKLREGFFRKVENNIIVNNSFHPHVWFKNSHDVFRNNVVTSKYAPIGITFWGDTVNNNLFPNEELLKIAQKHTDKDSKAGDPMFVDAKNGDFSVKPNSPALAVGFKNFRMDEFGVQYAPLKKIAQIPVIPAIKENITAGNLYQITNFLGGKVKSVDGLGDRSAYGLPDETGVIVIETGTSFLAQAGLQAKDVIRSANGTTVNSIRDLQTVYQSVVAFQRKIEIEYFRDQKITKTLLTLK